jgi:signal transduction histidine kinase
MTGDNEQQQGYIVNVQDVTLLKKLEEQAARRDRFTAMGEMAANIAHEIRNPLGSIELFASLVKKGLPPKDDKLEYINHITNGVASMNHIISNLLEYTKPRPVALQKVDLHKLVEETVEFTRFSASQNQVQMGLSLKARQCRIHGDPELLKQVFHNLILNAVQAMPDGGALHIASRQRKLTNPDLLSRLSSVDAERQREVVELSFKDEGAGMPGEIRKQIFDPFFTTKARGTGLGLSIVHNIMESHRAVIDVESAARQGTTFVLMFPTV